MSFVHLHSKPSAPLTSIYNPTEARPMAMNFVADGTEEGLVFRRTDHNWVVERREHPVEIASIPIPLRTGVLAPGWLVVQSFTLHLEFDENGNSIISDEIFDEYGVGTSPVAALQDYISNVISLYNSLRRDAKKHLRNQVAYDKINAYIQPTST
jgi:hypothetical protein